MSDNKPTPTNNLLIALVGIGALMILGLVALLIILDKDPGVYVGSITGILTTVVGLGLVGRNLNKRVDVVGKNVNGKMSALLDENARLRAAIGSTDYARENPAPELMSEDTIDSIVASVNELPSHDGQPYTARHQRS